MKKKEIYNTLYTKAGSETPILQVCDQPHNTVPAMNLTGSLGMGMQESNQDM